MLFNTVVASLLLAAAPLISAHKVHTVVVGGDAGLVYTPNQVTADPGDIIRFEFHAKNHTATQSAFTKPCVPLKGGFNSGFMPVAADATSFPTFDVEVKDKKPIFVHCEQTGHCPQGMVFAANAGKGGHSFDNFQRLALESASPASKRDYEYPPHIVRDVEDEA